MNALAVDVHVLLGHVTEEDPSNQVPALVALMRAGSTC